MRITRLYHPETLHCGDTTHLSASASNHLIRVLRSKIKTPVILFNGDGFDYSCKILDTNTKKTLLSIESKNEINNESNIHISLMQGLSRHDRMETTIQKSVELGVNAIIPVIFQRSNYKLNKDKTTKKRDHWRNVIISACEQSGRNHLPHLSEIVTLHDIESSLNKDALKIILDPKANTTLKGINAKQLEKHHYKIEVLIGPEGGLSDEEIDFVKEKKFKNICFGPRILRTETAGPAIISALQTLWGDLG